MNLIQASKGRKILLMDLDGPQANWVEQCNRYILAIDPSFPVQHESEWRSFSHYNVVLADQPDLLEIVKRATSTPGFYLDMPRTEGSAEAFAEIEKFFDVHPCTTPDPRNPTCASDKLSWIADEFGAQYVSRTMLVFDKTLCWGDGLVDDKPKITGALQDEARWQDGLVIYDKPYNQGIHGARVDEGWANWEDAFRSAGLLA